MLLQVAPPPPVSQAPPAPANPATPTPTPPVVVARVFGTDAGIIFNAVRPEAVKDFEMILGRLKEALAASPDATRRQQGQGWKIFKAAEAGPAGSVLYVFVMDPAVKGADYGVARILAEAYPAEAQELYRIYTAAFSSGQTMLNLEPR